jgi:hypothetical protein
VDLSWEKERTPPRTINCGRLIAFLGSDPFPTGASLPERLRQERRERGWSIRDAARHLGIVYLGQLGGGRADPVFASTELRFATFVGILDSQIDNEMRDRWNAGHQHFETIR